MEDHSRPRSVRAKPVALDVEGILRILPHRYPFILVDRILELEPGKRCVGLKNVTVNEPFFAGHFPQMRVMPAVLITEAMAQVGGVMILSAQENRSKTAFFAGIDRARFRRMVVPGDQLVMEVRMLRQKGNYGFVRAVAWVEGKVVAEGDLFFALREQDSEAPFGPSSTFP